MIYKSKFKTLNRKLPMISYTWENKIEMNGSLDGPYKPYPKLLTYSRISNYTTDSRK
jgi:hypothetical protein